MRAAACAVLGLMIALGAGSCSDYFDGTYLYFEFDRLTTLITVADEDKEPPEGVEPELCADDAYVAAHPDQAQPYEYQAWATINNAPVLLIRFTVRECTNNFQDSDYKQAVTTINYTREPVHGFPDKATNSNIFGVVNGTLNVVPINGAFMTTEVRLDDATEVFVSREGASEAEDGVPSLVLMKGTLVRQGEVLKAQLDKAIDSGRATGSVTVITADRAPAW